MNEFIKFTNKLLDDNNKSLIESIQTGYQVIFEQVCFDGKEYTWSHLNPPYNKIKLPTPDWWFGSPAGDTVGLRAHYVKGKFTIDDMKDVINELKRHMGLFADDLSADHTSNGIMVTRDKQGSFLRYNDDGSVDIGLFPITFGEGAMKAFTPSKNNGTLLKDIIAFGEWPDMQKRYKVHSMGINEKVID